MKEEVFCYCCVIQSILLKDKTNAFEEIMIGKENDKKETYDSKPILVIGRDEGISEWKTKEKLDACKIGNTQLGYGFLLGVSGEPTSWLNSNLYLLICANYGIKDTLIDLLFTYIYIH